ncbi:uncharacterized protein J4E92_001538 [Alternaria infectoria]|uniref:uncharacterized protein n=1 Tax=Alternaria infectoria TaxID=45303 RepID=UPI00221F58AA|nr:uncharacterized protein J4E92_001538 [Alternaria infectoria]KAI4936813.1 hypothetical protein J4E92_001538 [Alternaria infectoria]
MSRFPAAKAALLFALISVTTASLTGVILNPLISGTEGALKWQPVLDWDKDVCYQTSAIDSNGNTNPGLDAKFSVGECRDSSRQWNCNTYARERCNHGWCVYMYAYYSEMDRAVADTTGHHDNADPRDVRWEGYHPKLVAHRGGANTASLRLAKAADDNIENDLGIWQACHLQQIGVMDNGLAQGLLNTNWGNAHMDLPDGRFQEQLEKYMPKQARQDGFTARD